MYGEYVTLTDGENKFKIWVWCTPNLSQKELVKRAKAKLRGIG